MLQQHVLPTRDRVGRAGGQEAAQPVRHLVLGGPRDNVGGGALEHGDMRRSFGHRRNKRDGGGAAAYYDHPLAFVVEVFRPLLRVHNLPAKPLDASPLRGVPSLVVVVARAEVEETAGEMG